MATTTTATTANTVKTAYDRAIRTALRPHLHFDPCADVRPTMQDKPGATVVFTINTDIAANSTALDESTDVTPTTLASDTAQVTIAEYGDAVEITEKLRGVSFDMPPFDRGAAERVAFAAGLSLDTLARDVLKTGTNVRYPAATGKTTPTARNTVEPEDTFNADAARRAFIDLESSNVVPFANGYFKAFIHPDVKYDLRRETGAAAWRDPHTYSDPQAIYNGSIGEFEGFEWISTPRAPVFADAGSSTTLTDVYGTLFMGREALAKAFSTVSGEYPQVRIRPPVDYLLRKSSIGWYWFGGYGIFRQAAIRRVESSSSIGAN